VCREAIARDRLATEWAVLIFAVRGAGRRAGSSIEVLVGDFAMDRLPLAAVIPDKPVGVSE